MASEDDLSTDGLRSKVGVFDPLSCMREWSAGDVFGAELAKMQFSMQPNVRVDFSCQRLAAGEFDERLNAAVDIALGHAFDIGGLIAGCKDTRQFVQARPRWYGKMVRRWK